jgi:hypothetical protein
VIKLMEDGSEVKLSGQIAYATLFDDDDDDVF